MKGFEYSEFEIYEYYETQKQLIKDMLTELKQRGHTCRQDLSKCEVHNLIQRAEAII